MIVRPFVEKDRDALIGLWRRCELVRPWNDPDRDIDRNVAHDAASLLVAEDDGDVIGSVMVGYDGHRGWLNYLAVDGERRGTGLGRRLVAEAESQLEAAGCPKVNLQIRAENVGAVEFYRSVGYTTDDVVSMGKRLIDDSSA